MATVGDRVGRWKDAWRDVGRALSADEPLLCDDAWCDCERGAVPERH